MQSNNERDRVGFLDTIDPEALQPYGPIPTIAGDSVHPYYTGLPVILAKDERFISMWEAKDSTTGRTGISGGHGTRMCDEFIEGDGLVRTVIHIPYGDS